MTDELTIQQKKPSVLPYALGGAAIGGLGGAAAAHYKGWGIPSKYSSWEDVLNESNDTFDKRIENAGESKGAWETAKNAAKEVKDAEAEYDKKVEELKTSKSAEAIPEDAKVRKDLNAAKAKYEKAVKDKMGSSSVASGRPAEPVLTYDPKWDWGTEKQRRFTDAVDRYTTAKGKYEALESAAGLTGDSGSIATRKGEVETAFEKLKSAIESNVGKDKNYDTKEQYFKAKDGRDKLEQIVKDHFDITPTDEDYLKMGSFEKTKPADKPGFKTVKVTTSTGKIGYVQYEEPKSSWYRKIIDTLMGRKKAPSTTYEEVMGKKYESIVNMLTQQLDGYYEAKNQIEKLPETFNADKSLLHNAGMKHTIITDAKGKNINVIEDLESKIEEFNTFLDEYKQDKKALEKVKNVRELPKGTSGYDASVQAIIDKYKTEEQFAHLKDAKHHSREAAPKDIYEMLTARISVAEKYNAEVKALEDKMGKILANDPELAKLEKQLATLKKSKEYKAMIGAKEALLNRDEFRDVMPKGAKAKKGAKMSEDAAKKALEGTEVERLYLDAQRLFNEAVAKEGKELSADELAKLLKEKGLESKEAYVSKVKESAKSKIEGVLKDLKFAHTGWTAAAAAGILGLVGIGIAAASRNSKEA